MTTSLSTRNPAARRPAAKRRAWAECARRFPPCRRGRVIRGRPRARRRGRGARASGLILPGLATFALMQVGGLHLHGGAEDGGIADEGDAAVVADVEPFVRDRWPRSRRGRSRGQVGIVGRGSGPQAESAVDVDPCAGRAGRGADGGGGIEGAGVDVAGLKAEDGAVVEVRAGRRRACGPGRRRARGPRACGRGRACREP